jgi:hypothetical protein
MKRQIFLLALLILAVPSRAETIIVEPNGAGDFNNIQDAINYSRNGDVIEVQPGIYVEHINFYGRAITLTGTDPYDWKTVESTIIRSDYDYLATVRFESGEDGNSVLTGFTIENIESGNPPYEGIGIECYYSSPLITNNIIRNTSKGIIWCTGEIRNCIVEECGYGLQNCDCKISNCLILGNNSGVAGGHGQIINCTIVWNAFGLYGNDVEIKNCIVAFNNWGLVSCHGTISYNNVWGNFYGSYENGTIPPATDIHEDPLFADDFNDFHLKSEAGRWDANSETWVIDAATSLCIDAGDPCDHVGIEPNPNGGRINMGAYGGTAEASKSGSGIVEPVCLNPPPMDTNGDCKIDFVDFAEFVSRWMDCGLDPQSACWE